MKSALDGPGPAPYGGPKKSQPFEKWWAIANARRGALIKEEHLGGGLSPSQKRELELLQKVCDLVLSHLPFCCSGHEGAPYPKRFCACPCHLVGHRHERDAKGRCALCLKKLDEQRDFFRRQEKADKLLALVKRNGGL